MALPPLFKAKDVTAVHFQKVDGISRPDENTREPGDWCNCQHKLLCNACFGAVTQVTNVELTGADPSTGTWTIEVTPILSQQGAAAADAAGPATISIEAAADTLADVVTALIDAANGGANIVTPSDAATWNRFRSYVQLQPVVGEPEQFDAVAVAADQTFTLTITAPVGNGSTQTPISSPDDSTIKVGLYVAIDRTKGANGFANDGAPFVKPIETLTPEADIVGPVYRGADTEPVDQGFPWREYDQGSTLAIAAFGVMCAYGETAIPASSIGSPVYVRRTTSGDFIGGLVTDAAGAAVGATANVWTMTPVVTNDTLYQMQIEYGGEVVVLTYLSDGTAADTEITAGMLAQLNLYNGAGQPLEGITGVDGATLVLTGPADGRSFVVTSIGVGDMGEVETTPGVSTHIPLLARGDKFAARSTRIGAVAVDIPHDNA